MLLLHQIKLQLIPQLPYLMPQLLELQQQLDPLPPLSLFQPQAIMAGQKLPVMW
jgi:hypothetical protein